MWLEATRGHRSQGPVRTPSRALPTPDLNSQLATTRGAHPNPGRTAGRGCFGPALLRTRPAPRQRAAPSRPKPYVPGQSREAPSRGGRAQPPFSRCRRERNEVGVGHRQHSLLHRSPPPSPFFLSGTPNPARYLRAAAPGGRPRSGRAPPAPSAPSGLAEPP